jgi:phage terminase large subunit-like protein
MVRDKLDIAGRYSELKRLVTQWEPSAVYYKKTAAENEIEAIRIFQDRDRYRFPIFPLAEKASDGDKNTRIRRLVPDLEKLRWLFPKNAWRKMWDGDYRDQMSDFIQQEVMQFPHGEHDDFLDCLSGAYDIGEQWPQGTNKTRAAAFQFQVFDGAIAG